MKEVFDFDDYKAYLAERLATTGATRGIRSRLARHLGCQVAHVSQVLNGPGHFTLEHAALIDEFLAHGATESEAFLLLVHQARAGNRALAAAYQRRYKALLAERRRARIKDAETVSDEDAALALYYRSWHVAAIHTFLMIAPQDARSLAQSLELPADAAEAALRTLVRLGLAREQRGRYAATPKRWHLPPQSPLVAQHHQNWRLRALLALEKRPLDGDLHYSGPIAVAAGSAVKLRALLVQTIERMEPLIAAPGEDVAYAVCLDFFRLHR